MNIKNLIAVCAAMMVMPIAYASNGNPCSSEDIHCSYVTGVPAAEGRWLKIQAKGPDGSYTVIGCASGMINNNDVNDMLGAYHYNYSICKDVDGNGCQSVGSEDYTLSQTANIVSASSQYYSIDLSPFAHNAAFPACSPYQYMH